MKKAVCIALAAILVLLINPLPGHSAQSGHNSVQSGHSEQGWHGAEQIGHSGQSWHDGGHSGHSGHGGHVGVDVWIGPEWWGPFSYLPYYPFYPYYETPPAVLQQQDKRSEEQDYWYYCKNPKGYYPYVEKCPGGWMKVVPSTPDSQELNLYDRQPEEQNYWYYCKNPKGYYPYVKNCPDGWMKVAPSSVPLDQRR